MNPIPEGTVRIEATKVVGTAADPSMLIEWELIFYSAKNERLEIQSGTFDAERSPWTTDDWRSAVSGLNSNL